MDKQSKAYKIKEKCLQQNKQFQEWAAKKRWYMFHHSHFDWWAFPIDKGSQTHGDELKVQEEDKNILIADKEFIFVLRSNAELVSESWGWDLKTGHAVKNVEVDQYWRQWPIRLSKMCRSLQLFQQDQLCSNGILYGIILLKYYKQFAYNGRFLTPYFRTKYEEYNSKNMYSEEQKNQKVKIRQHKKPYSCPCY